MSEGGRQVGRHAPALFKELDSQGEQSAAGGTVGEIDGHTRDGIRRSPLWLEQQARKVERAADLREQLFGEGIFRDPAWYILLILFRCHLRGEEISVSGACYSARSPLTTSMRYIALLERRGLVERRSDPFDGRRQLLDLSADGIAKMRTYFARQPEICDD